MHSDNTATFNYKLIYFEDLRNPIIYEIDFDNSNKDTTTN